MTGKQGINAQRRRGEPLQEHLDAPRGPIMQDLPLSPQKLQLYSWHKWAGVTVFLLVLFRLAWRATHPPPPLPDHLPKVMRFAAHAGHTLLYGLMFVIPLSGWLMSSAKGFQTVWFGVLPLPDGVDKNRALGDLLAEAVDYEERAEIYMSIEEWTKAAEYRIVSNAGVEVVTVNQRREFWRTEMRYVLTNARDIPVTVELIQDGLNGFSRGTRMTGESLPGEQRTPWQRVWQVRIPANGETEVTATFLTDF